MGKEKSETLLEMKNISKTFPGVRALDNAGIVLKKGEIHALVGENGAGKSTLMNVLLGIHQCDSGEILFQGRPVKYKSPSQALNDGITMIHQESSMMPNMTIADNVWIAREDLFRKGPLIDKNAMNKKTRDLFQEVLNIDIDPRKKTKTLTIAQLQLVELCRAVSYNASIIVMDEPTSALTNSEVQLLYKSVRKLSAQGVTIIFISHKLEEIYEICDSITIMRDGRHIRTCAIDEINEKELIELIAGRELTSLYPKEPVAIGKTVLKVDHISREGEYKDVSFEVREGEVLGFCGLIGAGRTEIMQTVFGLTQPDSGEIYLDGQKASIKTPAVAIRKGIGLVSEDRLRQGIIGRLSVRFNMTITNIFKYGKGVFVDRRLENQDCDGMIRRMRVKTSGKKQTIAQLSGGNQQKVILGRSLLAKPKVLILDEPTRGIDVGSKSEIYRIINELAKEGMAVLMVSSETPELLGVCDRILVVSGGRIVGEFEPQASTQADLMRAAFLNA